MILLINLCENDLHFNEFVVPIGNVLIKNKIKGFIRKYDCLTKKDLQKASKIIICGTSLRDNHFLDHINKFKWILNYNKPILGICGGMQIIGKVFGGDIKKEKYIGLHFENFNQEFADKFFEGKESVNQVYHLHNYIVTLPKDFIKLNKDLSYPTAMKHKTKPFYGTLFHPEVRNKELILGFARL